jgi:hypothetical protein
VSYDENCEQTLMEVQSGTDGSATFKLLVEKQKAHIRGNHGLGAEFDSEPVLAVLTAMLANICNTASTVERLDNTGVMNGAIQVVRKW